MATHNNEVDSDIGDEPLNNEIDGPEATLTDYYSDSEAHASSYDSSDDDASDEEIDELELQQLKDKISCP